MLQKPTKIRKGRAANANISSSVGNLIGIRQSLKKGEARIGPDGSVPSLGNQFSETKKNALTIVCSSSSGVCGGHQKNKQRRADADGSIDHLFGQDECLKNQKKVRKRKTANANLSFGWRVHPYMAERQKREKERAADGSVPSLSNQLAETPKKRKQRSRGGCLDDCLLLLLRRVVLLQLRTTPKTTNKEEPTPTVRLTGQAKKMRKGIAADANLLCPVGVSISIGQSLKKGKSKDRGANGSIPLVTNQLAKTQK